jgi:hypothetical protein
MQGIHKNLKILEKPPPMNNLYVLVDFQSNHILTPIQYLPENWSNINGLNLMDEEKIKDLSWAGHDHFGWINIQSEDISQYNSTDDWLVSSKLKLKSLISSQRWEKENEILIFNEKQFIIDDRTKLSLIFKSFSAKENEIINWKFLNGTHQISSSELIEIYNFATTYIQNCFDVEYEFSNLLDNITTKENLLSINVNLDWPSTSN